MDTKIRRIKAGIWRGLLNAYGNIIDRYEHYTNFYNRIAYTAFFSPTENKIIASYNDGVRIWNFYPLKKIINNTISKFKTRKLSKEEKIRYFIYSD